MKRLCVSELLSAQTLDALHPIRREERLRLVAVLLDKAATREIINVSEELHKASNNEIIRTVTWMREGGGVDEAGELMKGSGGDNPDIQLSRKSCLSSFSQDMDPKLKEVKLLVDKDTNRVVFAESNKDLVDLLFSFLTLPLGRIVSVGEGTFGWVH
ncbi:hypothetical protein QJS04_geneDACA019997 [Acorus gramineus]|uniref:Uncharacterized protein n=1 Tax=Acorus gramineus TaxID=55184 RepID=A0AAV9B5Y0_ACOGR|nr:hypothetical protein QJS04_geneDACA019997 [Acorus gramineus]